MCIIDPKKFYLDISPRGENEFNFECLETGMQLSHFQVKW